MQIAYTLDDGQMVDVSYSEHINSFVLEECNGYRAGEILAYCSSAKAPKAGPNQTWLLNEFVDLFVENGIVEPLSEGWNTDESEVGYATLCSIIHPEFNDGGYSPFGDFSRGRLGQQCQYGSRYITGKIDGYPALGEGLRFKNLDRGDYHSIRIHRDDMDEFERRYKAYCAEQLR